MRTRSHLIIIILLLTATLHVKAQSFTSSNLPIVIINTDGGATIPDEPKISASMKIIWHQDGSRNYLSDANNPEYLNYDGRIAIETRGSSSQDLFPKKQYGFTTMTVGDTAKNNVSLLGFPTEHDWIFNSLPFDETGMRDYLAYTLSRDLGQYAPRCVYCEIMLNGQYDGLYMLVERIKVDKNRVNIMKLPENDNTLANVTGGYITKADKTTGGDPVAWTMPCFHGGGTDFIHHYPKPGDVTTAQNNYIRGVFNKLANTANANNESLQNGFPSVIDIPTFIDFMMIAEYTSNVDVYQLSTFFHKDRNGKLRAGPVWDYNLAFGYDEFGYRSEYDVWQFSNYDNEGPKFWTQLFNNSTFRCYLARRWNELTAENQPLNYQSVLQRITETDALITEAINRDKQRWGNFYYHNYYLNDMKEWLQLRMNWVNQNIGSCAACSNVETPPLVISKIHYHPMPAWGFTDEQLEFIEITNNGDEQVDLSGIYFKELGITYQFPFGSTIGAHEVLWLSSDPTAFREYYGVEAFGQYTRNLSNKGENLVLADAWGNIIDEVHYLDSLPWPMAADGNGPYLKLIDLNYDNSLAESWTTDNEQDISGIQHNDMTAKASVYPNPTTGMLNIGASSLRNVTIFNNLGQAVLQEKCSNDHLMIDMSHFANGIYLIQATTEEGVVNRKILLQR